MFGNLNYLYFRPYAFCSFSGACEGYCISIPHTIYGPKRWGPQRIARRTKMQLLLTKCVSPPKAKQKSRHDATQQGSTFSRRVVRFLQLWLLVPFFSVDSLLVNTYSIKYPWNQEYLCVKPLKFITHNQCIFIFCATVEVAVFVFIVSSGVSYWW